MYEIVLDPAVSPVKHAPKKYQCLWSQSLKKSLTDLKICKL